jgi:murein DD-endopeptidase MepM/ murein hydrolase activator NlpD
MNNNVNGLSIVALALIFFFGASLLSDAASASAPLISEASANSMPAAPENPADPAAFAAPYLSYVITQGPHGASYGHLAIDLAAGEDAAILSPITGVITGHYTDVYGNPTLVIENDIYQVTLLHGKYYVMVGQSVALGESIGSESNQGYTTDMAGNPCWGRSACGFHTHLNVFDKRLGMNVNPLDLLP